MTSEQLKILSTKLNDLTHIIQGECTPQRILITLEVLSRFPFDEICKAIEKGKCFWTFYPSPAQILAELEGDLRLRLKIDEMKQKEIEENKKKELT